MRVSGTPPSQRAMAGSRTRAAGIVPKRARAASQPPRFPGVAHARGPPASSSSVTAARAAPDGAPAGAGPTKSSTCRSRVRAREISMRPMPPTLDMNGSTTLSVEPTATAASTALPPSRRMRMPAMDASGCADVTAPRAPMTAGRYACR